MVPLKELKDSHLHFLVDPRKKKHLPMTISLPPSPSLFAVRCEKTKAEMRESISVKDARRSPSGDRLPAHLAVGSSVVRGEWRGGERMRAGE